MTLTKTEFRKKCLKNVKKSTNHNKIYKNYSLNKKLMNQLNGIKNQKILFYYPLVIEADIRKTLNLLRKKCDVYLPFMQGESFKMVPYRLPLKRKKFGIFESGNTNKNINKIDIAIVPTVGVDGNLQRIGFGKGMYDRFFAKLKKRPYIIFIQENFCYTKEYICDDYDIACDVLLTPKKELYSKRVKLRK